MSTMQQTISFPAVVHSSKSSILAQNYQLTYCAVHISTEYICSSTINQSHAHLGLTGGPVDKQISNDLEF